MEDGFMKRKLMAIILSVVLVASLFSGCSSKKSDDASTATTTKEESTNDSTNATEKAADTGEKVKLKALFISHPLTKSLDEMKWIKEIEDQVGVEIEWEQIYSDWATTKPTRFASGDIPDLLFNATVDSDYTTYDGLFMELTDLIGKDAPNITSMFKEVPETKALATSLEGKIYGTPKYQGKWPSTTTVMFINKNWLDNLGLQVPKTFSELKTVLEAFRDEDANGNGDPSDEVPLDFNGWFGAAFSMVNLVGAMGIQLSDWAPDAYFVEDSKVKNYAVDERYMLFMEYVADLYANGLINTNAITNDYSAFQSLSRGDENGNAMVGVTFGWEETDKFGPTVSAEYIALPALEYDINCVAGTYDTRWPNDFNGLNMSANRVAMSAKCANPDAAMKFIDAFYDATASVESLFGGIADGNIEKTGDNSYKVLDPTDPNTDPGTWKWTSTFADNGPMYIRKSTTIEMNYDMANALKEREAYVDVLAKMDDSTYYPGMFLRFSNDDQNTMAVTQANINNIINNQWSLWMTGQGDIESEWDTYVQSVNDAGLQQILDIRQAAYDKYMSGK